MTDQNSASRKPTNFRKTRRNQERNLVLLTILVLVVGGSSLIGLIWGLRAFVLSGICLVGGGVLIALLWLLLSLIQKLVED